MIVKERKKPIYLQQLEALYRRTLDSHPKKLMIKDALSRHLIGFKGELAIDFPLSFLAKERYMVLHGIRLNDGHYHFQIDTLILSQRFFLIVEIKNYSGSIYFDEQFHQMIQTYEQEEKAYPNPLLQIKRQEIQLKKWLIQNQVSPPPIESLVVFTNPYTIIRSTSHYLTNKVIRSEYLPTKMKEFERVYSKDVLTNECVKKVKMKLKRQHRELQSSILQQFQVSSSQLLKGVHCPKCESLPMYRKGGFWICECCLTKDKQSHIHTIKDYALLICESFSNDDIREFLQLESSKITNRLLKEMKLRFKGVTKDRHYIFKIN